MAKKSKLLQSRKAMREELQSVRIDWPALEQAARIKAGTIKAFVEDDKISSADLEKLDKLNRS